MGVFSLAVIFARSTIKDGIAATAVWSIILCEHEGMIDKAALRKDCLYY